ncbi:ATP-grasp domain-containing protein [Cellulomonas sp. H30R-01]|uniref:ATP-grasp domain-containing protein n=1 Tax=Cellulomonas sp. H30R-01 TaxID=2704467 RepID=UPI00138D0D0F|nr:ATP-grasp domain-containing protein [Cellulomonas sp. H30R-01]QHT57565.1 ATP-grasp domain-containing protein [Cellulomonas sp. H30R-01]
MTGEVLVLGWKPGLGQVLARAGVPALVVVGPDDAGRACGPGEHPADLLVVDAPGDPAAVLAALRRRRPRRSLAGVAALSERAVLPAAFLRAALDLPGLRPAEAVACRDKAVQKQVVRAAGLPVARAVAVEAAELADPSGVERAAEACGGLPVVVKPVDGVGAGSTTVARTVAELHAAVRDVHRAAGGPALVEELVVGREHHVDGWTEDGELRLASVSRYGTNVLAVRDGAVLRSTLVDDTDPAHAAARDLAARAVAALALTRSVFHLELFVRPDGGAVFSECGARPGGGFIPHTVAARWGTDLREVAVRLASGRPVDRPAPVSTDAYGFTFLSAAPGRIVARPADDDVAALPGVRAVHLPYGVGDTVPDGALSSGRRLGLALVGGRDDAELERRLDATVAFVHARTRVTTEVGR